MEFLRQLWNGIRETWGKLTLSARTNIVLAALTVIAVIVYMVLQAPAPSYSLLSSGLDQAKVSQIQELLTQQNIPFELAENNTAVRVPLSQKSPAQMLLAENNIYVGRPPVGATWDKLFAEDGLMATQWMKNQKLKLWLQEELRTQLEALEFVDGALVLIHEADRKLFGVQQEPSQATVTLDINRMPNDREKKAILTMISMAGGPQLDTNHIIVNSFAGEPLIMPLESASAILASDNLEYKAKLLQIKRNEIDVALKPLGKQYTLTLDARLNFDDKETEETKAEEGTPVSTYIHSLELTSDEKGAEGGMGAFANVPEASAAQGGILTTETETEEIQNLEPSVTRTRTKSAPGKVEQYTATLFIEGSRATETAEDGTASESYTPLSDTELTSLEHLLTAALGDGITPPSVNVVEHQFDYDPAKVTAAVMAEAKSGQRWEAVWGYIGSALKILMIILAFFLLRRFLRRVVEIPKEVPIRVEPREVTPEVLEAERRESVMRDISELAEQDPETAASLLRTWLAEDED